MKKIIMLLVILTRVISYCQSQSCNNDFPNADIATAIRLYDFNPITVETLGGVGKTPNEISLPVYSQSKLKETNSAWYTFEINTPGDLTFKITPLLNPSTNSFYKDDIDFVLYQQSTNGGWVAIRTSTSGPLLNSYRKDNMGNRLEGTLFSTNEEGGLNSSSNEIMEEDGFFVDPYTNDRYDGYLVKLSVNANEKYRLVVNNFFRCDRGFHLYWNQDIPNPPSLKPCDQLYVNAEVKHIQACSNPTGSIKLNVQSTGAIQYSWKKTGQTGVFSTSPSISNITQSGTYSVTVSQGNCYQTIQDINVDLFASPAFATISDKTINCDAIVVTADVQPIRSNQKYTWNGPDGILPTFDRTLGISKGGNYSVTLEDPSSGCQITKSFNVSGSVANIAKPEISVTGQLSCASNSVNLNVTNLSSCIGCTVAWVASDPTGFGGNSSATGASVVANKKGTYTAKMIDSNNCSNVESITISKNEYIPNVYLPNEALLGCTNNATVNLQISNIDFNNNSYQWSAGNGGNIQGSSNTSSIIATTEGIYNLTITSGNSGCTAIKNIQVRKSVVSLAGGGSKSICHGSNLQLNVGATGGQEPYTYQWSAANTATAISALSNTSISSPIFIGANLASGQSNHTFNINALDALGCLSNTVSMNLEVKESPKILSLTQVETNNSYILNANVASTSVTTTKEWTIPALSTNPIGSYEQITVSPSSNTTYKFRIADVINGCFDEKTVTVIVNNPIVFPMNDITICQGEQVNITAFATGGNTSTYNGYSWYVNGAFGSTQKTKNLSYSVTPTTTQTYQIRANDDYNRSGIAYVKVYVRPNPTLSLPTSVEFCALKSAILQPTFSGEELTFKWTPSNGLSSTNIAKPTVNVSVTTTYTLKITDKYGCTNSKMIQAFVYPIPTVNIEFIAPQTLNAINVQGGSNGGYTFLWTPTGYTAPTIDVGLPGNYTLKVTDSNGCTATASYLMNFATTLRGKIFYDFNKNGIFDANDRGVDDMYVRLVNSTSGVYDQGQSSNSSGIYTLSNVNPGSYYIEYDYNYSDLKVSPINQGNDDSKDSDVNVDGKTPVFSTNSTGIDFSNIGLGVYESVAPTVNLVNGDASGLTVNDNPVGVVQLPTQVNINDNFTPSTQLINSFQDLTNPRAFTKDVCNGVWFLKKVWKSKDEFNNLATKEWVLYAKDNKGPKFASTPANVTVNSCTDLNLKLAEDLQASDYFAKVKSVVKSATKVSATVHQQRWSAMDSCGNLTYYDRYITAPGNCLGTNPQSKINTNVKGDLPIQVFTMPNPTNGIIRIDLYLKERGTAKYELYDMTGRLIWSNEHNYQDTYFTEDIDLTNVPVGIYILRAFSGSNIVTEKIVKQ